MTRRHEAAALLARISSYLVIDSCPDHRDRRVGGGVALLRADDFFQERLTADAWPETVLDHDLVGVAKGTAPGGDVDQARAIVDLLRSELERFANGGSNRIKTEEDIEMVIRAARTACKRAGVDFPDLPFRSFAGWMNPRSI